VEDKVSTLRSAAEQRALESENRSDAAVTFEEVHKHSDDTARPMNMTAISASAALLIVSVIMSVESAIPAFMPVTTAPERVIPSIVRRGGVK
jgi:hypothetical protein